MKTSSQENISTMVKGIYDVQKLRIAMGQRILAQTLAKLSLPQEIPERDDATDEEKLENKKRKAERELIISNFLEKLGLNNTEIEGEKKKKSTNFFDIIIRDYAGITQYVTENHRSVSKAIGESSIGVISSQSEMEILDSYFNLVDAEKNLIKPLTRAVNEHPLWTNFLVHVKGCGPLMAGVILSEFDITVANYPSSFWKYAGMDTVILEDSRETIEVDGVEVENPNYGEITIEGRSRKVSHQVEVEYIDKNGEKKTRKGITFNPFLKTKLLGVLGPSFLKSGGYYSEIYYNYKNRLNQMPIHDKKTKGHKNKMAIRYMVKYFVADLHTAWCIIEGIQPPTPYHEEKLEMNPHSKKCPYLKDLVS